MLLRSLGLFKLMAILCYMCIVKGKQAHFNDRENSNYNKPKNLKCCLCLDGYGLISFRLSTSMP